MPAFLRSALQILFSEDSTKLFVASNQGSLHIVRLLEGSFKHLHTFQPQSGRNLVTHPGRELLVSDVSLFPLKPHSLLGSSSPCKYAFTHVFAI